MAARSLRSPVVSIVTSDRDRNRQGDQLFSLRDEQTPRAFTAAEMEKILEKVAFVCRGQPRLGAPSMR
jgi:hypothetical protein